MASSRPDLDSTDMATLLAEDPSLAVHYQKSVVLTLDEFERYLALTPSDYAQETRNATTGRKKTSWRPASLPPLDTPTNVLLQLLVEDFLRWQDSLAAKKHPHEVKSSGWEEGGVDRTLAPNCIIKALFEGRVQPMVYCALVMPHVTEKVLRIKRRAIRFLPVTPGDEVFRLHTRTTMNLTWPVAQASSAEDIKITEWRQEYKKEYRIWARPPNDTSDPIDILYWWVGMVKNYQ